MNHNSGINNNDLGRALMMTEERVNSMERQQKKQGDLEALLAFPFKGNSKKATSTLTETCPQEIPRGGDDEISIRADNKETTDTAQWVTNMKYIY